MIHVCLAWFPGNKARVGYRSLPSNPGFPLDFIPRPSKTLLLLCIVSSLHVSFMQWEGAKRLMINLVAMQVIIQRMNKLKVTLLFTLSNYSHGVKILLVIKQYIHIQYIRTVPFSRQHTHTSVCWLCGLSWFLFEQCPSWVRLHGLEGSGHPSNWWLGGWGGWIWGDWSRGKDHASFCKVLQLVPIRSGVAEIHRGKGDTELTQEPVCAKPVLVPDREPNGPLFQIIFGDWILLSGAKKWKNSLSLFIVLV